MCIRPASSNRLASMRSGHINADRTRSGEYEFWELNRVNLGCRALRKRGAGAFEVAVAWMADQLSLGPSADRKCRRPARSSNSSDQQLCLLHLRYRTGRQLSSRCRSTLWVESGRPKSAHSKSSRILSNGLRRGHGGSRDKRPLCPLNRIPVSRPRSLSCSSHPPNASNLRPTALSKARKTRRGVS